MRIDASRPADEFVECYSVWKTVALEIGLLSCAVFPLLPNFSEGLSYTAFWYTTEFFPFLVAFCAIDGLMFLMLLPLVWRALFRLPAVVISGGWLIVYSNSKKAVKISEIVDISMLAGSAIIKLPNRKSFAVPLLLCQRPSDSFARILNTSASTKAQL